MESRSGRHNSDRSARLALLVFALLLPLLLDCPHLCAAPAPGGPERPVSPDTELVVMLELDGEPMADSLLLTERGGKLFIPVCALAEALSLAISCDGARAFGFVLDQARPFVIDLDAGYTIYGREAFFIDGEAFVQKGEILVSSGALSRWVPVDFHLRQESSTLELKARETLPLQGLKKRGLFVPPRSAVEARPLPDRTPARMALTPPTADLASQMQFYSDGAGGTRGRVVNSLDFSGDLLQMTNEAHIIADSEELKRLDVTLSRSSASGYRIGPLRYTRVALGSIQAPYADGVGATTRPMYGVYLSNRPPIGGGRFLSHDIHGHLPPGWDAELFHNGTQIAYQAPTAEGMYHFVNLRVYYGVNSFKVVLHGPFGERKESEEVFVSDATTPTGELLYTLSSGWQTGLAQGEQLAPFRHESNQTLTADFGLSKRLTGSLLLVRHADRTGEQRSYLGGGVRTGLGYTLLSLEMLHSVGERTQGELLTVRSSSRDLFGLNLELVQRFFRNYYSPQFYYPGDPLRTQTALRGNSSLTAFGRIRVPYSLEVGVNTRKSGATEAVSQWRVSGGWDGWNAVLEADLSRLQSTTYLKGELQLSTRLRDLSIRGEAGYAFAPTTALATVDLNADLDLGGGMQLSSALTHDPVRDVSGLRLGLSRRAGRLGYSVSAHGSSDGEYGLDLGVRSSLAADSETGQVLVSAEPLAPYGMIAVVATVAEAGGGRKRLPGIRYLLNGGRVRTLPESGGGEVIAFLQPDIPVDVTVDMASVEDPFMVTLDDGCRIVPRAGVVARCDFTMITGGEIDGTVLVRLSQGGELPIKGVRVELFREQGGAAAQATTQSEESGYFLFKAVRPGKYRVAIPAGEIERLRASSVKPRPVTMPAGGDMVSGVNFLIEAADALHGGVVGGAAPVLDRD